MYPTINSITTPGNLEIPAGDDTDILYAIQNQAARLRGQCRLFVPKYQQMTIGTYSAGYAESAPFRTAYEDVQDAFASYMRQHNNGRKIVLIGHSQGSHMLLELLLQYFDDSPDMREQLLSAVLVGPVGTVYVPDGKLVGGTFANIPLCQDAGETGCVIAFDMEAEGNSRSGTLVAPIPDGMVRACVNPANLDAAIAPTPLTGVVVPNDNGLPVPAQVTASWAIFPRMFSAACNTDNILIIDTVNSDTDMRKIPVLPATLQGFLETSGGFGLHNFEFNFAVTDIANQITAQAQR